ncbi:MAG TPA: isochorismate synthase [Acidimicrobiales bacterium]|jgi:menaquinone-specific isochorismate synthase
MNTTGLHARTVALEYGPDALQFDSSPTVLFDRPGLTLVGWGTARLVPVTHAVELLAQIPCEDAVRRPGSGVLALGALPFTGAFDGDLIVPRFAMGIAQDADGVTRRWATAVGPTEIPLPETDELFDSVIWQYGTPLEDHRATEVDITDLSTPLSSAGYRELVAGAVATMRGPGATLQKVVLSRPVTAALSGALPLATVLRRMRAHEPACTIFSFPVPDGTFFGATPELLIARAKERVWCHPLAGTVARGTTARGDADAQGRLASSAKEHSEHRYVVDAIAAALRPFCASLTVPDQPSLVAFRSVAHLGTRIEGKLRAPTTVLELLAALHPTPAVGGTPRPEALAAIASGEPVPRGYWAGPVGWVDATGDGEWMIGIRSAQLLTDDETVTLHAGAGIVADSDPEAEAAEVDVKLATVLDSLVPEGSAHLR